MKRSLHAAAIGLVLAAAPAAYAAPLPKEIRRGDHIQIVGTWRLVESGSGTAALKAGDGSSWQFDAEGKAAIIRADGKIDGGIKFAIDPNESPKQFDWLPTWGNYRGCYTLDGDTLVLYLRSGEKDNRVREAKQASGVEVYRFERAK